jgi:hypothetical protein
MKKFKCVLFIAGVTLFLKSCGDELPPVSLLQDVRVAAAQFYVEEQTAAAFPSVAEIAPQNCQVWTDTKSYCQQYPVRPATKTFIKFSIISPEAVTPTFVLGKFTQLKFSGGAGGSLLSSSTNTSSVPVTSFSLVKNTTLSRIVQTTPMRIEEVVYEFTPPTATDLLGDAIDTNSLALPIFDVRYESQGKELESGFVNFSVLPDASDAQFWNGITSSEQAQNNIQAVNALRKQSKTNLPPRIGNLLPAASSSLGEKATLEFAILRLDTDENAKSRVQWYTTRGEFVNDGSTKSTWKSKDSGAIGVFAVVRDLQGGADTIFGNYLP